MTRTFFRDALAHTVTAGDGTPIVWHAHPPGRGAPVILTNGLSTTDEFWRHVVQALAPRQRVVHWAYRGHGESDSALSDLSLPPSRSLQRSGSVPAGADR